MGSLVGEDEIANVPAACQLCVQSGVGEPGELAQRLLLLHEGALDTQPVVPEIDGADVASQAARDLLHAPGITGC